MLCVDKKTVSFVQSMNALLYTHAGGNVVLAERMVPVHDVLRHIDGKPIKDLHHSLTEMCIVFCTSDITLSDLSLFSKERSDRMADVQPTPVLCAPTTTGDGVASDELTLFFSAFVAFGAERIQVREPVRQLRGDVGCVFFSHVAS